jgi:hypothetical protein
VFKRLLSLHTLKKAKASSINIFTAVIKGTAHNKNVNNGKGSAINRALDGSTYPG